MKRIVCIIIIVLALMLSSCSHQREDGVSNEYIQNINQFAQCAETHGTGYFQIRTNDKQVFLEDNFPESLTEEKGEHCRKYTNESIDDFGITFYLTKGPLNTKNHDDKDAWISVYLMETPGEVCLEIGGELQLYQGRTKNFDTEKCIYEDPQTYVYLKAIQASSDEAIIRISLLDVDEDGMRESIIEHMIKHPVSNKTHLKEDIQYTFDIYDFIDGSLSITSTSETIIGPYAFNGIDFELITKE